MLWTEEMVERLKYFYGQGLSCSMIANEIGNGISRNAVIGKIHRINLPPRDPVPSPNRNPHPRHRKQAPARRWPGTGPRDEAQVERAIQASARAAVTARKQWKPLNGKIPVGLLDLKQGECRWPVGEDTIMFCGEATEKHPYCPVHTRVAYQPPSTTNGAKPNWYR